MWPFHRSGLSTRCIEDSVALSTRTHISEGLNEIGTRKLEYRRTLKESEFFTHMRISRLPSGGSSNAVGHFASVECDTENVLVEATVTLSMDEKPESAAHYFSCTHAYTPTHTYVGTCVYTCQLDETYRGTELHAFILSVYSWASCGDMAAKSTNMLWEKKKNSIQHNVSHTSSSDYPKKAILTCRVLETSAAMETSPHT